MTLDQPDSIPSAALSRYRILEIIGTDSKNLHANLTTLENDAPLLSALNSAHLTLDGLPAEASLFLIPPDPQWHTQLFLRGTEFAWAAAVRSVLMHHWTEALSNIRTSMELLGCALVCAQSRAASDADIAVLKQLIADTSSVGKKLRDLQQTPTLVWLKDLKKACSTYGAHGNSHQIAGRIRDKRCSRSGSTSTISASFAYADIKGPDVPAILVWLIGIAADTATFFSDDLCKAADHTPTPAFHSSVTELDRHKTLLSMRFP